MFKANVNPRQTTYQCLWFQSNSCISPFLI